MIEEYKRDKKRYEDFCKSSESLIEKLLIGKNIKFHKIEARVKGEKELEEKIANKNKYSELSEITDLIGIRIITYFEDEVDTIAKVIENEFIKDKLNSIDKRKLEADKFGYRSLHYVVGLNEERKKLTEYQQFKDLKIEVQIRSILQHAWAEIEHDIGYKGLLDIPNSLKRSFYRVAALLETADIEFIRIREDREKYELSVEKSIKKNPSVVEINLSSLNVYISNNSFLKNLDKKLTSNSNIKLIAEFEGADSNDISRLYYLEIQTIKELDTLLKEKETKILEFALEFLGDNKKSSSMDRGVSIFYLCYLLAGETLDLKKIMEYYASQVTSQSVSEDSVRKVSHRILSICEKIK